MSNLPEAPQPPTPPKGETWTKVYDCGCSASGGKDLPDYCAEHGTAPPTKVRAKFVCNSYETSLQQGAELRTVKLSAVYDGSPENKQFFKWTPNGQITMGVLNQAAWESFTLGKEFYVDFVPCANK